VPSGKWYYHSITPARCPIRYTFVVKRSGRGFNCQGRDRARSPAGNSKPWQAAHPAGSNDHQPVDESEHARGPSFWRPFHVNYGDVTYARTFRVDAQIRWGTKWRGRGGDHQENVKWAQIGIPPTLWLRLWPTCGTCEVGGGWGLDMSIKHWQEGLHVLSKRDRCYTMSQALKG